MKGFDIKNQFAQISLIERNDIYMKINSSWFSVPPSTSQKPNTIDKSKTNTDFKATLYTANNAPTGRVDKLEISASPMALTHGIDIAGLKARLSVDIDKETSAQKIIGIAEQINNNEYIVNSNELAKFIRF